MNSFNFRNEVQIPRIDNAECPQCAFTLYPYVYRAFLSLPVPPQPSYFPSSLPSFQNIKHLQHTKSWNTEGEWVFCQRSMVPSPHSLSLLCCGQHHDAAFGNLHSISVISSPHLDFLSAASSPSWTLHYLGYLPPSCASHCLLLLHWFFSSNHESNAYSFHKTLRMDGGWKNMVWHTRHSLRLWCPDSIPLSAT